MKKDGINETDEIVANAIDAAGQADDNLIRLSTGVVLKAKQASPTILIRVMTAKERPEPPVVFIKAMGREMENPDDPDYIDRVQAWEMNYKNSMLNALVGLGTELVSIPNGMEGPHPKIKPFVNCGKCKTKNKSERESCSKCGASLPSVDVEALEWVDEYKLLGMPTHPESSSWRYITWIMFKAAPTDKDIQLISEKVKRLSGVPEADVQSAETFPGSDEKSR